MVSKFVGRKVLLGERVNVNGVLTQKFNKPVIIKLKRKKFYVRFIKVSQYILRDFKKP